MLRKTIIALGCFAMLAATLAATAPLPVAAQGDSGLRLISEFNIPGARNVKYPHVAAGRGLVTVTGNANRSTAFAWTKAASASAFGSPFDLGPAEDQPDFSTTSVAIGPDGSTWAAWVNQPSRTIYLRQRNPQGQWGPRRTVDGSSSFPINIEVAVSSNNQIFVAWRDIDRPIRYRFSTNSGENWSSRRDVSDVIAYRGAFGLAGGPGGRVGVAFTAGFGNKLQIFVGLWNGTSFTTSRISPSGADWADPTISFAPSGQTYVAWRGVTNTGGNAGAFFAERQPDGSWPRSRLVGGLVDGPVTINADEAGNLHMAWIGEPSGGRTVFYAFKPATAAFRGPIGSGDTGALFNSRASGSVADATYGHVVAEEFNGNQPLIRYSLFSADATSFGGEPLVESGAARVAPAADGTVKLTFRTLAGNPTQIRWRWGAAPTDAASDSNSWQALSGEMRIPVPQTIRNDTSCQPKTLYTQLRNATTTEPQARSVAVNLDGVVEAQSYLDNAYARASAAALQGVGSLAATQGAPGGAPNYTRVPLAWLNVVSDSDCSGITVAGVGASADKIEQNFLINDSNFGGLVALPNLANLKPGPVPFVVRVLDGAGNVRLFNLEVILDETKPILNAGTITASSDPEGDLLQVLSFTDINVTDTQYPSGFWGVWIANAIEPVSDPLNDPSLKWTVLEAPDEREGNDFVIDDWSLATGLTKDQLVAGEDYFIYIRFLDGAGNPTDSFITVPVARSNVVRPDMNLPLLRR